MLQNMRLCVYAGVPNRRPIFIITSHSHTELLMYKEHYMHTHARRNPRKAHTYNSTAAMLRGKQPEGNNQLGACYDVMTETEFTSESRNLLNPIDK